MLIDTHCHLYMYEEIDKIIEKAKENRVSILINVGCDIQTNKRCLDISREFDCVYATCGIHPHEAKKVKKDTFDEMKHLIYNSKVVAVGEIGLDYVKEFSPRDIQQYVFRRGINLAREVNLPIVVHTRGAFEDTYLILKEEHAQDVGGVIHCFSEDKFAAKKFLDLGFYLSFTGIITYKNTKKLQDAVKFTPVDRILLETDAPFLPPSQKIGLKNEPAYLVYIARKIAEIKHISYEELCNITTENAKKLFKLEEKKYFGDIIYVIGNNLYFNITNQCTNDCIFCVRKVTDTLAGYKLTLAREPKVEEILNSLHNYNLSKYKEVVFCGFGEPTMKLDIIKDVAKFLKKRNCRIRLNTNGHGNLINKRNILPELEGLIDCISVSLNAENAEKYFKICRPIFGIETYNEVKKFILEAKKYVKEVIATVVSLPEIDISACKKIAYNELGVKFRVR